MTGALFVSILFSMQIFSWRMFGVFLKLIIQILTTDPVFREVSSVFQQHAVHGIHSIPDWLFHINLLACPFPCPIM